MSSKAAKDLRKQLKPIVEAILPAIIAQKLFEEIRQQVLAQVKEIEKYTITKLEGIDQRHTESMKHIVDSAPKWLEEYAATILAKKDGSNE